MELTSLWSLVADAPGDSPALWCPEPLRFAALRERAEAEARALVEAGVGGGDRVLVQRAGPGEVVGLFAVWRLGAVAVPLHPHLPPEHVAAVGADCGARARLGAEALAPARADLPPAPEDPEKPAVILYTSGSTGPPRGVTHRHRSLLRCARGVAGYLDLGPGDRLLGALPLSFHYGMSQVTSAFSAGASVALPASPLPGDVLQALRLVTVAAGVPLSWSQLLPALEASGAPPDLRLVTIAGGAASGPLLERLERALPGVSVVLLYGFTEALRATWLPPALYPRKRGAMGVPVPDAELEVVDEAGRPCGPDEVGELVQRGPLLGDGYWAQPEASAERWRPLNGEIACFSGDLVRRDADGVFWFVSRKDGVIKTGGFRVGPGEIEAAVRGSGLAEEAVAFGVPDPERGQVIELAIEGGDPAAVLRFCRRALPGWMVPRRVHAATLPRRPNGKVDRAELQRRFLPPG